MDVSKIPPGREVPHDINVVIEIPDRSSVKYEIDRESGAMFVDRFLLTPMSYPAAYGFIPGTLADDGEPADALVLAPAPVVPGAILRARPIGMLQMEDEGGQEKKIICVPHGKVHSFYQDVQSIDDLPEITRKSIEYFFSRYKDLEPGKWAKVRGWSSCEAAHDAILKAIAAATA